MLDLESFIQSFIEPFTIYCGISQLIRAGTNILPEQLQLPRIVWEIDNAYIPGAMMPVLSWETVPGIIDPNHFSQDIRKSVISNPRAILSFTIHGNPGDSNNIQHILKAREWFVTPFLGPEFLSDSNVVVAEVTEIQYCLIESANGPEERGKFTVTFQFEEKVQTVIRTIETVLDNGKIQI